MQHPHHLEQCPHLHHPLDPHLHHPDPHLDHPDLHYPDHLEHDDEVDDREVAHVRGDQLSRRDDSRQAVAAGAAVTSS